MLENEGVKSQSEGLKSQSEGLTPMAWGHQMNIPADADFDTWATLVALDVFDREIQAVKTV